MGQGDDKSTLRLRIRQRFETVEKAYTGFLQRNPRHSSAHGYGSFLVTSDAKRTARRNISKRARLIRRTPRTWNNLANYYGHVSPVTNAFACYEKAIELIRTSQFIIRIRHDGLPVRVDATNYYKISVQRFDKAMGLSRKALALDPDNFPLATDLAQTYYASAAAGKDAFRAWNDALRIARDDMEREGTHIPLARWHRTVGDVGGQARVESVTNALTQRSKEDPEKFGKTRVTKHHRVSEAD